MEDDKPVAAAFARLQRQCSTFGVRLLVHEASLRDVARDQDAERRSITESKIQKFEVLKGVPTPDEAALEAAFGRIARHNDLIDCILLDALSKRVVDFLVTQDAGLQKRANACGLGDRVFNVEEALEWLRQAYEPKAVALPYIEERYCYQLSREDLIFETLREDYPEFDEWFQNKCVRTHRKCWVLSVNCEIAGILIWKDEARSDSSALLSGERILKICTFKVAQKYRGEKFGELLLKQVLWFAQRNRYDVVYVTAYPRQSVLLTLLEEFGFHQMRSIPQIGGDDERQYEKAMGTGLIAQDGDALSLDREHYPRFVDDARVRILCVPIQPAYHRKLFPEKYEPAQPMLFDMPQLQRTPGNTIRKVYLCRSAMRKMAPGDLLMFYMSKDEAYFHSRTMTSVGVVEKVSETKSLDELLRLTGKRSVFSREDLERMVNEKPTPLKVVDFLLVGHFDVPIGYQALKKGGVLRAPPQSIMEIGSGAYSALNVPARLGFQG